MRFAKSRCYLGYAGRGERRRSPVRLIVMDAHQPKPVRSVRAAIVVRPEADVSIVVDSFRDSAQRVAAGLRGEIVEE
jgi:hypothetical protein